VCKWKDHGVMHDATHHYFKDLNGNVRREQVGLQGVPCDAALFAWPNTKAAWRGGSCWLIRLCEDCAVKNGIVW
jgi:hypothetical protein